MNLQLLSLFAEYYRKAPMLTVEMLWAIFFEELNFTRKRDLPCDLYLATVQAIKTYGFN